MRSQSSIATDERPAAIHSQASGPNDSSATPPKYERIDRRSKPKPDASVRDDAKDPKKSERKPGLY